MEIDLEDVDELLLVLNGAAVIIQSAWRAYKCRESLKLANELTKLKLEDCYIDEMEKTPAAVIQNSWRTLDTSKSCLIAVNQFMHESISNNFLCDVIIYVQNSVYYCHSVVLWSNSGYFRDIFQQDEMSSTTSNLKYKFELFVSCACWELVQRYIYGHDITVDADLIDELMQLAQQLRINDLIDDLDRVNRPKNSTITSTSNSTQSSCVNLSATHPPHLINDYYKFFKCVVHFYTQRKLSLHKTFHYLSSDFIDYSKMTEHQLEKCILLLKTRLRLKNSQLISNIIEHYLNEKIKTVK